MQDVKEMAKAAGQSFPGFTPPNGETQEQVRLEESSVCFSVISLCMWALFIFCPASLAFLIFIWLPLFLLSFSSWLLIVTFDIVTKLLG